MEVEWCGSLLFLVLVSQIFKTDSSTWIHQQVSLMKSNTYLNVLGTQVSVGSQQ